MFNQTVFISFSFTTEILYSILPEVLCCKKTGLGLVISETVLAPDLSSSNLMLVQPYLSLYIFVSYNNLPVIGYA